MENGSGSSNFSTARFMIQLIAYTLAFAIPTIILSIVFKTYIVLIIAIACILFFVGIGFMVGLEWFDPKVTEKSVVRQNHLHYQS